MSGIPTSPVNQTKLVKRLASLLVEVYNRYEPIYRECYTGSVKGNDPTADTALGHSDMKEALIQHIAALRQIEKILTAESKRLRQTWKEPRLEAVCKHCTDFIAYRQGLCPRCYTFTLYNNGKLPNLNERN